MDDDEANGNLNIKLTIPHYFTDYRTETQKYNDGYLENFLFIRLVKREKFISSEKLKEPSTDEESEESKEYLRGIMQLIKFIESKIAIKDNTYLDRYDGQNEYWESKNMKKNAASLQKKKIKYEEEYRSQKGGGNSEIDYYKTAKEINAIKNYMSYAKLISGSDGKYDSLKELISEDLIHLIGDPSSQENIQDDILNLLMGRNIEIKTCNDNIKYILAESKYRSIRDSPILSEADKISQCEKYKKLLIKIIDEHNEKCKNKIDQPKNNYWLNFHNNRSFYAINYNCENYIVHVPYNKFAGDKIVMNLEYSFMESVLKKIKKKCNELFRNGQNSEIDLKNLLALFNLKNEPSEITNILKEFSLNRTFNPKELISYNLITNLKNSNFMVFLEYLIKYLNDVSVNEFAVNYNLQSPVIFSYTINNDNVKKTGENKIKDEFNCKTNTRNLNYNDYIFINVPSYLRKDEYFQVNLLNHESIFNDSEYNDSLDNDEDGEFQKSIESMEHTNMFIKFNIDDPSKKYSILLISKNTSKVRYYIPTIEPPNIDKNNQDSEIKTAKTAYTWGDLFIQLKYTDTDIDRQDIENLDKYLNEYSMKTQENRDLYTVMINYYDKINDAMLDINVKQGVCKILDDKIRNFGEYQKLEESYIEYNKAFYNKVEAIFPPYTYSISKNINQVKALRKFEEESKGRSFIYPDYSGITNFYSPLHEATEIEEESEIEAEIDIIIDPGALTPPPPQFPRLDDEYDIKMETIKNKQYKNNLSDAQFDKEKQAKVESNDKILDPARIIIKYTGERGHDGKKNGYGVAYYKNGNKYEGKWEDNIKTGSGVSTEIVNYITEEIGCVVKFYYKGFNILNNSINGRFLKISEDDDDDSDINMENPSVLRVCEFVGSILELRDEIKKNTKNASDIAENVKYVVLNNFEEEIEELEF
jgi:hypothetical protein